MNKTIKLLFSFFILIGLTSCQINNKNEAISSKSTLKYAKGFDINYSNKKYTQITVFNPWNEGEVYATYYLIKDSTTQTPINGKTIQIPIKTLMTNSATHLCFLEMLGVIDKIVGVCNAEYIFNPTIHKKINQKEIIDLGDAFNLDIERLMLLYPDAIMTSAYNANDENNKRLQQTGLHLLYNIEWQEETLLGRAEWIKFVAAFFDKDSLAQKIFTDIEQKYNTAKSIITKRRKKNPSVLVGQDFRGTWSMPGGKSFNAELFRNAGVDYYYSDNKNKGSLSTTIEEALVYFNKADLWINVQASTLKELIEMDNRYKLFYPYKTKEVYNFNKRKNNRGGNDYWELGVARPDLLLKDLIKIAHPHLLLDYELTFMKKLN